MLSILSLANGGCQTPCLVFKLFKLFKGALPVIPSQLTGGRKAACAVLAVEGCLLRSNGGCQTPCLVISACGYNLISCCEN